MTPEIVRLRRSAVIATVLILPAASVILLSWAIRKPAEHRAANELLPFQEPEVASKPDVPVAPLRRPAVAESGSQQGRWNGQVPEELERGSQLDRHTPRNPFGARFERSGPSSTRRLQLTPEASKAMERVLQGEKRP